MTPGADICHRLDFISLCSRALPMSRDTSPTAVQAARRSAALAWQSVARAKSALKELVFTGLTEKRKKERGKQKQKQRK